MDLYSLLLTVLLGLASVTSGFQLKPRQANLKDTRAELQPGSAREILQDEQASVVDICYEGCFAASIRDLWASPLPQLLVRANKSDPMQLMKCLDAVKVANLAFFAIVDEVDCYGGDSRIMYWQRLESCPMECHPNGSYPFTCGGNRLATLFSFGECVGEEGCQSDEPPLPLQSPPHPHISLLPSPSAPSGPPSPAPPSPPHPPAPARSFRCKDGIHLLGAQLATSPVRFPAKPGHVANLATCHKLCEDNLSCVGFYYKTANLCYMMASVSSWGRFYRSVVKACWFGASESR